MIRVNFIDSSPTPAQGAAAPLCASQSESHLVSAFEPEHIPRLVGGGQLTTEYLGYGLDILHHFPVALRELPRAHVDIVLHADADVPTEEWASLPEIAETPLGVGAYVIKNWGKGVKIELEENPYYYKGPLKIKKVTILMIGDTNQAVAQLLTGDVDVIGSETLGAGPEVQTVLDNQDKLQVLIEPSATWEHIDMNLFLPYVLEYNVRFGDPETQAVLLRLDGDLLPLLLGSALLLAPDLGPHQAIDVLLDVDVQAPQVHQRVGHHLTRPVVGDLAAAPGALDRHAACVEHMLLSAGDAERVDAIELDHLELVRGCRCARLRERAHRGAHSRQGQPLRHRDRVRSHRRIDSPGASLTNLPASLVCQVLSRVGWARLLHNRNHWQGGRVERFRSTLFCVGAPDSERVLLTIPWRR